MLSVFVERQDVEVLCLSSLDNLNEAEQFCTPLRALVHLICD